MKYYHAKKLDDTSFSDVVNQVTEVLKTEGFGILTEIDVQATMKKKLDKDMLPYLILGACNPSFAYKALQTENKIGTMLPCNVVVQQLDNQMVEVAAVDPMASMQAVENKSLADIATEVQDKLKNVIDAL